MNLQRFRKSCGREFYEKVLAEILGKTERGLGLFVTRYPHVSRHNIYTPEENTLWTSSFFPGIAYLAYDVTGDGRFLVHAGDYLGSFGDRIENRKYISHDLGFLYTLSCVALHKLTGDKRALELARTAADVLAGRYNPKGKYIQAWGEMGISYPDVKIIIDTMMNLPLLYWSGSEKNFEIARNHARTSAKYLIRGDYTSYHTYLMRPETGEAVCGRTHQGFRDESTWARGQAWAVYGYALSYRYTKEKEFLEISEKAAEVFIGNLPGDFVPYWDFTFTDENPDIRDTSAASVFCCGLLELCRYVDERKREEYRRVVDAVMDSLFQSYSTRDIPESTGFLTGGMYHRDSGANECTIWGDYFYFEAVVRLLKDWNPFW